MLETAMAQLVGAAGMAVLVTRGSIFFPVREKLSGTFLGELTSCPMCTGFWTGLLFAVAFTLAFGFSPWCLANPFGSAVLAVLLDPNRLWR